MGNGPEETTSGYGLASAGAVGSVAAPEIAYQPPRPARYRPKVGIIGCGGISEYHLRAYRALGLDVVALCDVVESKARDRAQAFYPDARITTDYRAVLAASETEVVDIALHPAERVPVVEAALRAGKHVLSQKPFVEDLDVGLRLCDLADARGRVLAVNQNGRWAPHLAWMRLAVAAGHVGEVASLDCALHWDHTWTAGTPFDTIRHLLLYDFGIHWFDFCAAIFAGQTPLSVQATVDIAPAQRPRPPMLAQVVVRYPNAQARICLNGQVLHGQQDSTTICGTLGTLRSVGSSLSEQTVHLHTAEGTATPTLEGTWFESGFQGAMGELLCAIEERRAPLHHARANLHSLALCFAACASADAGGVAVTPGTARRAPQ